ncbi:unnamed protein product [Trichobilharzia szidati]|nr:unnamed protein product [Trichobilharzia szidati]
MTSSGSHFVCGYIKQLNIQTPPLTFISPDKSLWKYTEKFSLNLSYPEVSTDTTIFTPLNNDYVTNFTNNSNFSNIPFLPFQYNSIFRYYFTDGIPFQISFRCHTIDIIWKYILPLLFLIGTVGNILSFLVFYKRKSLYPSSHIYLIFLAIMDEGVLCTGLLTRWLDRLLSYRLEDRHWLLCKSMQFIGVTTSFISVWIIVLITVERTLVVMSPISSIHNKRVKCSCTSIIILCILASTVSGHFFLTVDLVTRDGNKSLDGDEDEEDAASAEQNIPLYLSSRLIENSHFLGQSIANSTLLHYQQQTYDNMTISDPRVCDFHLVYKENGFQSIWTWIDATLYSYLPFIIIVISNILILINIRWATKRRASMIYRVPNTKYYHHCLKNNNNHNHNYWNIKKFGNFSMKLNRCTDAQIRQPPQTSYCGSQSYASDRFTPPPQIAGSSSHGSSVISLNNLNHANHKSNSNMSLYSANLCKCKHPCVSMQLQPYTGGVKGVEYKTNSIVRRPHTIFSSEMRQLTLLLMLISGVFLLTTAPVVVVKLLVAWNIGQDPEDIALLELFDCIAEVLMYANHAINFYLYCAVGTRFRRELKKTLRCGKKRR